MTGLARQLASANGVAAIACYAVLAVALIFTAGPAAAFGVILAILVADLTFCTLRRPRTRTIADDWE
ncbi:hypothetical protein CKO28_02905 [Rhodovibrio sodomensis]|uniref:Uncharacterized protein n=1 Tax=Rhodovibrio sodomensis TaxID=1088 RepID=A0ABS1DA44_9PROT|nr:hypothetical protein [Rhodovibrio sodomensis]MBK1666992.1 hypothetical protein [Rhodovibrio sodomensis]